MDIQELIPYLQRGKMGILPGCGYIKWDYAKDIPYFCEEDIHPTFDEPYKDWKRDYNQQIYVGRKDLYYII